MELSQRYTVRLPEVLLDRVKTIADRRGCNPSDLVRHWITIAVLQIEDVEKGS